MRRGDHMVPLSLLSCTHAHTLARTHTEAERQKDRQTDRQTDTDTEPTHTAHRTPRQTRTYEQHVSISQNDGRTACTPTAECTLEWGLLVVFDAAVSEADAAPVTCSASARTQNLRSSRPVSRPRTALPWSLGRPWSSPRSVSSCRSRPCPQVFRVVAAVSTPVFHVLEHSRCSVRGGVLPSVGVSLLVYDGAAKDALEQMYTASSGRLELASRVRPGQPSLLVLKLMLRDRDRGLMLCVCERERV
eukprot:3050554-Rhodomonas_salina.2